MSLFERFFGHASPEGEFDPGELIARNRDGRAISYQLLFMTPLDLDEQAVQASLRAFHPELAEATVEIRSLGEDDTSGLIGLAGWGDHVVQLFGMNFPIPEEVFDLCVRTAHYGQPLKDEARKHQSHLLLYYAGDHGDPLERYVAMTALATALARFDAVLVMNEAAHASFPAAALLSDEPGEDTMQLLRTLPIPLLYGGFVKMEVEDRPGVWMRTFGNALLELPDLAMQTKGHHEGGETFDLFANMLAYLHDSRVKFAPGHTMQVGPETYLRLRLPDPTLEYFLDSDGEIFVAEKIGAGEINH